MDDIIVKVAYCPVCDTELEYVGVKEKPYQFSTFNKDKQHEYYCENCYKSFFDDEKYPRLKQG